MQFRLILFSALSITLCQGFILDVLRGFTTCSDSMELKSPVADIDQTCLDDADNGMCRFYGCFERRYPCDSCGFAKEYGQYVCEKFHDPTYYSQFNDEGQIWVNSTTRCLLTSMKEMYQRPSVSCETTKITMIDQVSNCYLRNDANISFCDIAVANRDAILGVFEAGNFVKSHRVLTEVVELITSCAGSQPNALGERVKSFLANRRERIDDIKGRVKEVISNATTNAGDRIKEFVSKAGSVVTSVGDRIKGIISNSRDNVRLPSPRIGSFKEQSSNSNDSFSNSQLSNNTDSLSGEQTGNNTENSNSNMDQMTIDTNQTLADFTQNETTGSGTDFLQFIRNLFG